MCATASVVENSSIGCAKRSESNAKASHIRKKLLSFTAHQRTEEEEEGWGQFGASLAFPILSLFLSGGNSWQVLQTGRGREGSCLMMDQKVFPLSPMREKLAQREEIDTKIG